MIYKRNLITNACDARQAQPQNLSTVTPSHTWVSCPRKLSKLTVPLSKLSIPPKNLASLVSSTPTTVRPSSSTPRPASTLSLTFSSTTLASTALTTHSAGATSLTPLRRRRTSRRLLPAKRSPRRSSSSSLNTDGSTLSRSGAVPSTWARVLLNSTSTRARFLTFTQPPREFVVPMVRSYALFHAPPTRCVHNLPWCPSSGTSA